MYRVIIEHEHGAEGYWLNCKVKDYLSVRSVNQTVQRERERWMWMCCLSCCRFDRYRNEHVCVERNEWCDARFTKTLIFFSLLYMCVFTEQMHISSYLHKFHIYENTCALHVLWPAQHEWETFRALMLMKHLSEHHYAFFRRKSLV